MFDEPMERLLAYDRWRYWLSNGWSLRFRAWRVEESRERPYGIRYSFTLHDVDGQRLLGFDNRHAADRDTTEHDHQHAFRNIRRSRPYIFVGPDELLADFFEAVRKACAMEGVALDIEDEDLAEPGDGEIDDDADLDRP